MPYTADDFPWHTGQWERRGLPSLRRKKKNPNVADIADCGDQRTWGFLPDVSSSRGRNGGDEGMKGPTKKSSQIHTVDQAIRHFAPHTPLQLPYTTTLCASLRQQKEWGGCGVWGEGGGASKLRIVLRQCCHYDTVVITGIHVKLSAPSATDWRNSPTNPSWPRPQVSVHNLKCKWSDVGRI